MSNETRRVANLCCGHAACQREVADLLAADRATHEALREAARNMVTTYDASCPDWWPQEIEDLRAALAATDLNSPKESTA